MRIRRFVHFLLVSAEASSLLPKHVHLAVAVGHLHRTTRCFNMHCISIKLLSTAGLAAETVGNS